MFYESLIGLGVILTIAGIIFYFPEFGIFGHVWSNSKDDKKSESELRPAGRNILITGLIFLFVGVCGLLFQ